MIKKNFWLIIVGLLVVVAAFVVYSRMLSKNQHCRLCAEEIHPGMGYTVILTDGGKLKTCCPTCGLRFEVHDPTKVASASATDYATGKIIDAASAYFVEGSDVPHCDPNMTMRNEVGDIYTMDWHRCYPSLVAFNSRAAAEAFQAQHGGRVVTHAEAMDAIKASQGP